LGAIAKAHCLDASKKGRSNRLTETIGGFDLKQAGR
jgi:hypothetical protein